ncbi:MAG: 50S ribosomal protein L32e [Candidatus Woesearchaeota archaeon]
MNEITRLLEVKKELKRRTPNFLRQDAHKRKKISQKWRKPKGMHSKMRRRLKGYRRSVEVGFKSPIFVKGLDKEGLLPVRIFSVKDLEKLDTKKNSIIIGRSVGNKKRISIVEEAKRKGIKILNIKPEQFLEKIKSKREAKNTEQKEVKKEPEKEAKKKEKLSEEDKKKQQAKEKEKVLTKRI